MHQKYYHDYLLKLKKNDYVSINDYKSINDYDNYKRL